MGEGSPYSCFPLPGRKKIKLCASRKLSVELRKRILVGGVTLGLDKASPLYIVLYSIHSDQVSPSGRSKPSLPRPDPREKSVGTLLRTVP